MAAINQVINLPWNNSTYAKRSVYYTHFACLNIKNIQWLDLYVCTGKVNTDILQLKQALQ